MVYIMVRNLHLTNGNRQTPYKKKQNKALDISPKTHETMSQFLREQGEQHNDITFL
jgi:hypothetical protein